MSWHKKALTMSWHSTLSPLNPFIDPRGVTIRRLDNDLIQTLVARGELPSEVETRQRNRKQRQERIRGAESIPASPFGPATMPIPPLLPQNIRAEEPSEPQLPEPEARQRQHRTAARPECVLIWRKTLPKTDALQVRQGTAHVGGVRLTQARSDNPPGQRIDHTSYFRRLFADYHWEREVGRHRGKDQEHAFVPMRIIIRGIDYGIHNFEISHKPSGEAGQANYTTILRWGREFTPIVMRENLTDTVFSLYETTEGYAAFLIEITDT